MQNQLRINYRSGYLPFAVIGIMSLVYTASLFYLNLGPLYRVTLLVAGLLVLVFQGCQLNHGKIQTIRHDGEQWLADSQGEIQILQLHPDSFVSRYLLVPVFTVTEEKKKYRLFFTRQNCSESEFRHLCRLLVA